MFLQVLDLSLEGCDSRPDNLEPRVDLALGGSDVGVGVPPTGLEGRSVGRMIGRKDPVHVPLRRGNIPGDVLRCLGSGDVLFPGEGSAGGYRR